MAFDPTVETNLSFELSSEETVYFTEFFTADVAIVFSVFDFTFSERDTVVPSLVTVDSSEEFNYDFELATDIVILPEPLITVDDSYIIRCFIIPTDPIINDTFILSMTYLSGTTTLTNVDG